MAKGTDVGLSRELVKPQAVFCKDFCEYSYRVSGSLALLCRHGDQLVKDAEKERGSRNKHT